MGTAMWCQDVVDITQGELGKEDMRMFTASEDKRIGQWIAGVGQEDQRGFAKALVGAKDAVLCLHGVPGYIYAGSRDGIARSYDCLNGYQLMTYKGHKGPVTAVHCFNGIF